MAFPSIRSQAVTASTETTSVAVNYPGTISAGDTLLAFATTDGDNILDWATAGWTELDGTDDSGGRDAHLSIAWKKAAGTESGTFTLGLDSNEEIVIRVFSVQDADDPATRPPEVNLSYSSASTTIAFTAQPDLTPTGGAKDYLWFIVAGYDDDDGGMTENLPAPMQFPSNYDTNGQYDISSTSSGSCSMDTSWRQYNGSVEAVGDGTAVTSEQYICQVCVVHPSVDAPETFNRTLSDDLTLTDTISRDAVNTRDLSDALTLSENLQRAKIANYTISDSLSLTEQMELHFVRYRILSDALTLTENLTRDTVYTRDLLDSLSLTETLNRHAANARILADAFALTDSIARDVVNVRLLADDLTLTDSLFRDVVAAPVAGLPTYGIRRRAGRM